MKTQDEILEGWAKHLLAAFELEGVQVDVNGVLSLAGVAAHSIVRPAAPLTTFIAGYAAGLAEGAGQSKGPAAMTAAMELARKLSAEYPHSGGAPDHPARKGTTDTDATPVVDPAE